MGDAQGTINLLGGIVITGLAWALKELWAMVKELSKELHSHRQKVAEEYVTKGDFKEQLAHIRDTVDNIWKAIRKGE